MKYYWSRHSQTGMGMTEVLIAMMLLGIGVIGFAGLQVRAISATNDSSYRMQAMAIARDVSERLRLNPSATALAIYQPAAPAAWTISATNAALCDGVSAAACTPTTMARYDMAKIAAMASEMLPNGQVSVQPCQSRTNSCIYVSWNTTTPTVGDATPNCVTTAGIYVSVTPPNATDCVMSET